jgi:hypothetical protein
MTTTWTTSTSVPGIVFGSEEDVKRELDSRFLLQKVSLDDWRKGTVKTIDNCLKVPPCVTSLAVLGEITALSRRWGKSITLLPCAIAQQAGYSRFTDNLLFTPQDLDNPQFPPSELRPGLFADEVLLHELVHAVRAWSTFFDVFDTDGFEPKTRRRDDQNYWDGNGSGPLEELYAIVITNIYRSENGRPHLRKDHDGNQCLPADLQNPAKFADVWRDKLVSLKLQMPSFVRAIAAVRCAFNPLAMI